MTMRKCLYSCRVRSNFIIDLNVSECAVLEPPRNADVRCWCVVCLLLEADLARSLLFSISNDIGQIASLYALMHSLKKVSHQFKIQLGSFFCYSLFDFICSTDPIPRCVWSLHFNIFSCWCFLQIRICIMCFYLLHNKRRFTLEATFCATTRCQCTRWALPSTTGAAAKFKASSYATKATWVQSELSFEELRSVVQYRKENSSRMNNNFSSSIYWKFFSHFLF